MRIVGGTCGPDGVLGAYVTLVIKGGPADTHGLCEGKPIQINMSPTVCVSIAATRKLLHTAIVISTNYYLFSIIIIIILLFYYYYDYYYMYYYNDHSS